MFSMKHHKKSFCLLYASEQPYSICLAAQCLDFCLTLDFFICILMLLKIDTSMARCDVVRKSFMIGEYMVSGE